MYKIFIAAFSVMAVSASAEILLPAHVACLAIKDAKNYEKYMKTAPEFASDLKDRAACYMNKDEQKVIVVGTEAGFQKVKLLSGHTVWVRKEALKN